MIKDISELLDMTATERDLREAVMDDQGVLYSEDGVCLLECRNKDLRHYTVKEGCKIICEKAFFSHMPFASDLEDIVLPDGLLAIGNAAFLTCGNLRDVTLPESLRYIGESAFELCRSLESITLPSGLKAMGGNPLADSGIKQVVSRSPHFRVVDGWLMQDDTAVARLTDRRQCWIPGETKKIGDEAFSGTNHVHELSLPEGLEEIGNNAFHGCDLQSLTIPSSVRKMGNNPFSFATIRRLEVQGPHFTFNDGFLLSDEGKLVAYMGSAAEVVVPDTVTEIGAGAFYNVRSMQSVVLPQKLKTIRHHAFAQCENMTKIYIPDSVGKIEEGAFEGCRALRTLKLPVGITFVADSLLANTGIEEMVIPDLVTYIGKHAFDFCTNLRSVTIPVSVKNIDDYAFFACEKLGEVKIPNGGVRMGSHVFASCNGLQK